MILACEHVVSDCSMPCHLSFMETEFVFIRWCNGSVQAVYLAVSQSAPNYSL